MIKSELPSLKTTWDECILFRPILKKSFIRELILFLVKLASCKSFEYDLLTIAKIQYNIESW